jgi:hypothetical protein
MTALRPLVESLESRTMLDIGGSNVHSLVIGHTHPAAQAEVDGQQIVLTPPTEFSPIPGIVFAGGPFSVTATMEDAQGNVLTTFNGTMTIALTANPGGATLGGTRTATVSRGVATFSGLMLSQPGSGYVLQVSGAGLKAATAPFDVVPDNFVSFGGPKFVPGIISTQGVTRNGKIDQVILGFEDAMQRGPVVDLHNYRLLDLGTTPQYPEPQGRPVRLSRAAYHARTNTVTLTLRTPVGPKDLLWLSVNGKPQAGLRATNGRYLADWFNPYPVSSIKLIMTPEFE